MDFMTELGTTYYLFWRTNLLTGDWLSYTNVSGSGNNMHISFTNTLPQAFFQIQAQ